MFKKVLQSRWFTGLALAALAGLGVALYKLNLADRAVGQEAANLQQKIDETRRAAARLEQQNANADNPAFLERQARAKLNYKKPDENVVFVYRNQYNPGTDSVNRPTPVVNDQHWYEKLWGWLENKFR